MLFYPLVLAWNGTWWVYIAETYPTRVRGTADSWQVGLNDAAWILGSLAYGFVISAAGFLYTYLLIGALPVLLGAILVATKGIKVKPDEELEEIIV
ncbi:MFS transporter [Acidiplasma cupricumulans]|uniref:MFS transporter n=1 Tax=Acidiplasma cupricumulans TaxID=312540 RepID=UPI0007818B5F|nr:MFS transporter [Acidiplasma cupricumulans]